MQDHQVQIATGKRQLLGIADHDTLGHMWPPVASRDHAMTAIGQSAYWHPVTDAQFELVGPKRGFDSLTHRMTFGCQKWRPRGSGTNVQKPAAQPGEDDFSGLIAGTWAGRCRLRLSCFLKIRMTLISLRDCSTIGRGASLSTDSPCLKRLSLMPRHPVQLPGLSRSYTVIIPVRADTLMGAIAPALFRSGDTAMYSITPIPAFSDNYIWCLVDENHQQALVVDPGDARPVIAFLEERQLSLQAILITHHHPDHTGGLQKLTETYSPQIYGPAESPSKGIQHPLNHGDHCQALGLDFTVVAVPGHTLDHIAFIPTRAWPSRRCSAATPSSPVAVVACSRAAPSRCKSPWRAWPPCRTRPGSTVPTNTRLPISASPAPSCPMTRTWTSFESRCKTLRDGNRPTLPVTLGDEKRLNPFLRWADQPLISAAMNYASLRSWPLTPISRSPYLL